MGLSDNDTNYIITVEPVSCAMVTMTFITEAAHAEAGSGNAAPNVYAFQTSSFASEFEENK